MLRFGEFAQISAPAGGTENSHEVTYRQELSGMISRDKKTVNGQQKLKYCRVVIYRQKTVW